MAARATFWNFASLGRERLADAVADEVERDHGQKDRRSGLLRELKGIRERGGCCDIHLKRGMTATAVPILLSGDEVVGSLGCYSPLRETDHIRQKGLFQLLQEMASRIGREAETPAAPRLPRGQ